MNLEQGIIAAKKLFGIQTRTPPFSVVAFVLMTENGVPVAYANKTTGLLTDPVSGTAFKTAVSTSVQAIYSANGAIAIANGTAVITKTGSLAVMTLAVPTTAQNGTRITITSMTAFAHTITCPSAIVNNGVTGDPFTVITLAAFAGGGVTLEAYNGLWNVVANVVSTFA